MTIGPSFNQRLDRSAIVLITGARLTLMAILSFSAVAPLRAAPADKSPAICTASDPQMGEPIVGRSHEILVGTHSLKYISRAGRLPIIDVHSEQVRAWIYFSAYIVERAAGQHARPLTFIWNGGPGASSSLTHMAGLGPRRIVVPDNPPFGGHGTETIAIVDNPDTWLSKSDLVFVDPVGTGFSRATSPEMASEFFGTRADAESIAEFIRVYRNRFKTWDQPVIEGGESYGVTRAAWVAEALLRRKIPLSGVLAITWDIPLGDMPPLERHALSLPTFTAAAFYHRRLAPDLQADFERTMSEVADWSQGEYLEAVHHRDRLTPAERAAIVAKLARYTGLDASRIDSRTLIIPTGYYSEQLLKDRQLALGRYDSRYLASSVPPLPASGHRIVLDTPDEDLLERYLRDELGVRTDLQYAGDADLYSPTENRRGIADQWAENGADEDAQRLEAAFRINPGLKIFEVCGYYDLGANCIGDRYVINQAGADIARNFTLRLYKGGHAPYYVSEVRSKLQHDFAEFVDRLSK
jgi:carboxypeptidase C (cathepsin A)